MKIYEQYYEFKMMGNLLVRLWIKGHYATELDMLPRVQQLKQEIQIRYQGTGQTSYMAEEISHLLDVAAVHVQDTVTGFGNVIYNDWP